MWRYKCLYSHIVQWAWVVWQHHNNKHCLVRFLTTGQQFTALFNIQQFYVLPTQCIYVFCVDLRTNSDYFPIHCFL